MRKMDHMLIELTVVLVAHSNNPSILNPDFLIRTGVVDDGAEVEPPAISTPAFSRVRFKGGAAVTADPDRVIFSTGDKTAASIAKRYLQQVPHVPYRAIGVNPKLFAPVGDQGSGVATALRDHGTWMSFKDVAPEVFLKFVYVYGDRTITLDVSDTCRDAAGETLRGQMFQANVHRDLSESNVGSRNERIGSILDAWKGDLDDVRSLIGKFREEE